LLSLFLATLHSFLLLFSSDAPALSTDAYNDGASTTGTGDGVTFSLHTSSSNNANGAADATGDAQWDDEALAAATSRKGTPVAASAGTSTKDWADLKALDLKTTSGNNQDDIAKKLQMQETRAQLAAAREGMEREAQRIKEEKDKKEQAAKEKTEGSSGGKWVPSRMRSEGMPLSSRFGAASGGSQNLNTEDENLFPDLAAADAIMEKKKQEQLVYTAAKKTPVGGGATWGSRPKLNLKPKSQPVKEEEDAPASVADEPIEASKLADVPTEVSKPAEELPKQEEPAAPAETMPVPLPETAVEASAAAPSTPAPAPIKPKKKKKKDISTFGKKEI
jgi:hypothetical protein